MWRHSDEGGGVSWSPDSRSIAVTSDSDIYVIRADGSAARKLVVRGDDVDPAWQPVAQATALASLGDGRIVEAKTNEEHDE